MASLLADHPAMYWSRFGIPTAAVLLYATSSAALSMPRYSITPSHWVNFRSSRAAPSTSCTLPGSAHWADKCRAVVRPRAVADTVAAHGLEQEDLESFLLEKVRAGAPLPGTYPPNEQTLAEYEKWKRRRATI